MGEDIFRADIGGEGQAITRRTGLDQLQAKHNEVHLRELFTRRQKPGHGLHDGKKLLHGAPAPWGCWGFQGYGAW